MQKLLYNIRYLLCVRGSGTEALRGGDMDKLKVVENAYMLIRDGRIADYGPMEELGSEEQKASNESHDLGGRTVMPAWYDSHTHLVFAGSREKEFTDRIRGLSYQEIAERGGGILNSAKRLRETSEEELTESAMKRLDEISTQGTAAVEIKSGYGLDTPSELKMLRVIKKLKSSSPVMIKSTFLGAHAIPPEYKDHREKYIDCLVNEMIPAVKEEGLAEYVDVFCEKNYFTLQETERILDAGIAAGLRPKVHVNQFTSMGGVPLCTKKNALSADHLEVMEEADFSALEKGKTLPVALPSCSFFLGIPYAPGREMIDRGLPLVLASDFNPGSTPSGNMHFVVSLACIKMKLTPAEAIQAATYNGACAMELQGEAGSIEKGQRANLIITRRIPSYEYIPYAFGSRIVDKTMINGNFQKVRP